jgi:hypothetical protein
MPPLFKTSAKLPIMKTIDPSKYTAHTHSGKFEGETAATEYFYEQMLDGDGETVFGSVEYEDESAVTAELFHINADEAEAFNLPIGHWFLLREDSQGFAYGSTHATREQAEQKFQTWIG